MNATPTPSYTRLAVAIVIAAVLISASILFVATDKTTPVPNNVVGTTTVVSTITITLNHASSGTTNASIGADLLAGCSRTQNSSGLVNLHAGTNQPVGVCLQVYYYNSIGPLILNVGQVLSIQGYHVLDGSVEGFSGAANFTVIPSQETLVIGGPNNENEGATIAYAITANAGASGTYGLGFFGLDGLGASDINSGAPFSCGQYGELVAGTGQPSYEVVSGCVAFTSATTATSSSDYHMVPGASFPLPNGNIYFVITGTVAI